MGIRCSELDVKTETQVSSKLSKNYTVYFSGKLNIHFKESESILLSNIAFSLVPKIDFEVEKICYGDVTPDNKLCIIDGNMNDTIEAITENSVFEFRSTFDNIDTSKNTLVFDGVIDEQNLSLKYGRMFSTASTCYNWKSNSSDPNMYFVHIKLLLLK